MRLVSADEMARADTRAQTEFHLPGIVLMESAGRAAWQTLRGLLTMEQKMVVFVAGTGNNGGDALVMARYCHLEGWKCAIVLIREQLKGDAEAQRRITTALNIDTTIWSDAADSARTLIESADIIVDGIAGTGLNGALRSPHADVVAAINRAPGIVCSIDAPSGVGDDTPRNAPVVRARHTFTLGLPKRCLYQPGRRAACGTIHIVPFTLPVSPVEGKSGGDELLEGPELKDLVPELPPDANKGTRGRLAVYAGSVGTTGAAVLAGESALAAGAGLVTVHACEEVYEILASRLVSVMVRPEGDPAVSPDVREGETALVGPGWGTGDNRRDQLSGIVDQYERGVLDADGLTILSRLDTPPSLTGWVLTPHPGELARLAHKPIDWVLEDLHRAVLAVAEMHSAIVIGKSESTMIGRPDGHVAVVDGMNPALGTAGSGDVLAGIVAAQLCRGASAWDAARAGVLLHAAAGRKLACEAGLFMSSQLVGVVSRLAGYTLIDGDSRGC